MPVFHPCRGRGALPRASGDWRETFPRCTRGKILEEQKVQQEHTRKYHGSGPAAAPKPGQEETQWRKASGEVDARANTNPNDTEANAAG